MPKKVLKTADRNEYQRQLMRKRRMAERTVVIPECSDPALRSRVLTDLWSFGNHFFKHRFYLASAPCHKRFAEKLENVVTFGGNHAIAMPRGSAKTTWMEIAAIYAVVKGLRKFVLVVGATKELSESILNSIKMEFESNDELASLFPEICKPIQAMDGVPARGRGMYGPGGLPINLVWKTGTIELPYVQGSAVSGAVIRVVGIDGSIRGRKHVCRDGRQVRPDLVLIDDPQTRDSAKSPTQCTSRLLTINGDIAGLAGPGKKLAVLIACTVIEPNDLAAQILDPKVSPQWGGEKVSMMTRQADRHKDLWMGTYAELRKNGQRDGDNKGVDATDFYFMNRRDMDAGCEVYWPARHNADEISAVQSAYNLLIDYGEEVFQAEYQNDPRARQSTIYELSAEIVASKLNHIPKHVFAQDSGLATGFIDMNQYGLHWAVCSFRNDLTAYAAAYGVTGEVWNAKDPKGRTEPLAFYESLKSLCDNLLIDSIWTRNNGQVQLDLLMIDCGYLPDTVFSFCRQARYGVPLIPSRGRAALKYRPASVVGKPGEGWFATDWAGKGRVLIHNSDFHRMNLQKSFLLPAGAPGSTTLFGDNPREHYRFAEQITAEKLQEYVRGDVCDHYSWTYVPGRKNDLLDCMVGCRVGASFRGAGTVAAQTSPQVIVPRAARSAVDQRVRAQEKKRRW